MSESNLQAGNDHETNPGSTVTMPAGMRPIGRAQAREVAIRVLRSKAAAFPELLFLTQRDTIKLVTKGLKRAFEKRGFFLDEDAADGVYEGMCEVIPGCRMLRPEEPDHYTNDFPRLAIPPRRARLTR
jgi:hypothetical protein